MTATILPTLSPAELRRPPAPDTLAVLSDAIQPGGRVRSVRRLRGGVSSGMHLVTLQGPDGARRDVVVRRYGDWRVRHDPRVAEREWSTLVALTRSGTPAPRPLWADHTGAVFGCPTLVISRVPGRGLLAPRDRDAWVGQLAETLARIHGTALTGAELDLLVDQRTELSRLLDRDAPPKGLAEVEGGPEVWTAMRRWWPRLATPTASLLHGDYWPGNTLWRYGRLTGVIDWEQARRGDPSQDVGCCRLDLSLLIGRGAAETFLRTYEAAAGRRVEHLAFWDLYMVTWALVSLDEWVTGYQDLGRADLTLGEARARLDRFLADALARAADGPSAG